MKQTKQWHSNLPEQKEHKAACPIYTVCILNRAISSKTGPTQTAGLQPELNGTMLSHAWTLVLTKSRRSTGSIELTLELNTGVRSADLCTVENVHHHTPVYKVLSLWIQLWIM